MAELLLLKGWTPGGAGIWVLVGIAIITAIKGWPKLKEMQLGSDTSLRTDLMARVDKLEKTLDSERALHEAERSLDRHRLNNVTQCLDALLMLLEADPKRAAQAVAKIKEMRAEQMKSEALEKSVIHAAVVAAKGEI